MESLVIEKIKTRWKQIRAKMSTFDAYFTKGTELYDDKKYSMAVEFLKIALSQYNAQSYANYNLALAYQQLKKDEDALHCYEKFLADYPNDQSSLFNSGLIYYKKEDFEKASDLFLKSFKIKQDKESATALTEVYLKLDNFPKIIDFVEYILNSNCDKKYAFEIAKLIESQERAIIHTEMLDYALDIYYQLFNANNKDIDVILAIAIVYAKKGDWNKSIEFCQKALEIKPRDFEANLQIGLAYYCAEDMEKCIQYYEKALSINSKSDYRIYSNLAYAYEKVGEIDKAIELFKEMVSKFATFSGKDEIIKHTRELVKAQKELQQNM